MQNLVQNGYVIACGAFMDRTDYRTMIPMLEKLEEAGFPYDSYCADSEEEQEEPLVEMQLWI